MKIAIMGSGGIGGYYGGKLANTGQEVAFIARGAHLNALRQNGLVVRSHFGDFTLPKVQATDSPTEIGVVDLVIMAIKAYDLESATESIRPLIGENTSLLPLLNGVDIVVRIGAIIGPEKVIGGLCGLSSSIAEPGVISQVSPFEFLNFGEMSGKITPRAQAIYDVLKQAEINVTLTDNIQLAIWDKFTFLAAIAGVCSLTRAVVGKVRTDPDVRALLEGCIAEILAIGEKQGVVFEKDFAQTQMERIDGLPESMKPSMMLDLERGNRLELEALNGTVVRMGEEAGIATPVNRFIHTALKLWAGGR